MVYCIASAPMTEAAAGSVIQASARELDGYKDTGNDSPGHGVQHAEACVCDVQGQNDILDDGLCTTACNSSNVEAIVPTPNATNDTWGLVGGSRDSEGRGSVMQSQESQSDAICSRAKAA